MEEAVKLIYGDELKGGEVERKDQNILRFKMTSLEVKRSKC